MKKSYEWDETDLLGLIQNQTKESIELDYKSCDSLQKTEGKKNELSKDVSALANSAGGTLVYGITEDGHVPTGLDIGYDPTDITKEWIDQVINSNIHPRIEGLLINQIELTTQNPGRVAYVLEVPQSTRGPHQAADKRYHKRFNFESVAMEDYEIRDIMRRASSPNLRCKHFIEYGGILSEYCLIDPRDTEVNLVVQITNEAPTPAEYAVIRLFFDPRLHIIRAPGVTSLGIRGVEFLNGNASVYQAHWSIPGKMPLLQGIAFKLLDNPIGIMTAYPPITRDKPPMRPTVYSLAWEAHSPGMTTTIGTLTMHVNSNGVTLDEAS